MVVPIVFWGLTKFSLSMRLRSDRIRWLAWLTIVGTLLGTVLANDILKTTGYTTCLDNSQITVSALDLSYDRSNQQVKFDVGGTSMKEQNVTASLFVTAYGNQVYQKDFNPCDEATKVAHLCPGMYLPLAHHPCLRILNASF